MGLMPRVLTPSYKAHIPKIPFFKSEKSEILSFAGKWMELENIILSEVSLAQKTKNRMFSLIRGH
jgi:hypothetical protein